MKGYDNFQIVYTIYLLNNATYASLSSICTFIQRPVYVITSLFGSNTFTPKLACIPHILLSLFIKRHGHVFTFSYFYSFYLTYLLNILYQLRADAFYFSLIEQIEVTKKNAS